MIVKISTKHFKLAKDFYSNDNCPLAVALKEKLNRADIKVGGVGVEVGVDRYQIPSNWPRVAGGSDGIYSRIQRAKNGKRVKTVVVELTKVEVKDFRF